MQEILQIATVNKFGINNCVWITSMFFPLMYLYTEQKDFDAFCLQHYMYFYFTGNGHTYYIYCFESQKLFGFGTYIREFELMVWFLRKYGSDIGSQEVFGIIIFVSSSYCFIDYWNKMLVYFSKISVTLNYFWEHCSRVP